MSDFLSGHLDSVQAAYAADALARQETILIEHNATSTPSIPQVLSADRLLSLEEAGNIGREVEAQGSILPHPAGHYGNRLYLDESSDPDAVDVLAAASHGDIMAECLALLGIRSRLIYQFLGIQNGTVSPLESTSEHDTISAREDVIRTYEKYADERDAVDGRVEIDASIAEIERQVQQFADFQKQASRAVTEGEMPLSLYVQLVSLRNSEQNTFASEILNGWEQLQPSGVFISVKTS